MSLNVLIVDDSAVMRSVVKKVLNRSGFELGELCEAGDGQEALDRLDEHWIDVVLTDINMPVMNGFELLKRMKDDDSMKHIPVVIISTEVRDEKIEEILGLGAAGYITKPFKPEDIRDIFTNSLGVTADASLAEEPEDSDF